LGSHQKWAAADKAGKFTDELVSVELPTKKGVLVIFSKDELPRPDTTMDAFAKVKTIYGSPTVTAGNAPGLDAGATAVIIMRRSKAESFLNAGAAFTGYVASAAVWPRVTPLSSA
jgi:acetyl-CoA C-acetyltransferase